MFSDASDAPVLTATQETGEQRPRGRASLDGTPWASPGAAFRRGRDSRERQIEPASPVRQGAPNWGRSGWVGRCSAAGAAPSIGGALTARCGRASEAARPYRRNGRGSGCNRTARRSMTIHRPSPCGRHPRHHDPQQDGEPAAHESAVQRLHCLPGPQRGMGWHDGHHHRPARTRATLSFIQRRTACTNNQRFGPLKLAPCRE